MSAAGFWDRPAEARKRIQEVKSARTQVERWERLKGDCEDLETFVELLEEGEDPQARAEGEALAGRLVKEIAAFELTSFFSSELDSHDAVVAIHPGAGGTESQDWA